MKPQFYFISFLVLLSCNTLLSQTLLYNCKNYISDTSNTVILPFSVKGNPFTQKFKAAIRPRIDYCLIEELLIKAIHTIYFETLLSERKKGIEEIMTSYKKQLIFSTDNRGQLFVWINFMCKTRGDHWRSNIPLVFDGGACYFNLKLNLTTKEYFDFSVNSSA